MRTYTLHLGENSGIRVADSGVVIEIDESKVSRVDITEPKPACETCRFWNSGRAITDRYYPDGSPRVTASCRRRAPNASISWPTVASIDWCGEYERAVK